LIEIRARRTLLIVAAAMIGLGGLATAAYFSFGRRHRPPEFRKALESPVEGLTTVLYSPDGRYLVAGSASGQVIGWNVVSGKRRTLQTLGSQPILAIGLSSDGVLLAGGVDQNLVAWTAFKDKSKQTSQTLSNLPAPITALAVRGNRPEFAVGLSNGFLYVFGRSETPHVDLEHEGSVKSVAYHPRQNLLVTGGSDGRIVWRDAETNKVLATSEGHTSEVSGLLFAPDRGVLVSGDWNGEIIIWDVRSREQKTTLKQPDAVSGMVWTGSNLVTGGWDGRLRFWSLEQKAVVREIDTGDAIHGLAVSPAGDTIATVSRRNEVQLWRVPSL